MKEKMSQIIFNTKIFGFLCSMSSLAKDKSKQLTLQQKLSLLLVPLLKIVRHI